MPLGVLPKRGQSFFFNLVGLLIIASSFSGLCPNKWISFASLSLEREISRQFLPDGGYFENSTGYHRFVLESIIFMLSLGGKTKEITERFSLKTKLRIDKALYFFSYILFQEDRLALIGDFDSGHFFKFVPRFIRADEMVRQYAMGFATPDLYLIEDHRSTTDVRRFLTVSPAFFGQGPKQI